MTLDQRWFGHRISFTTILISFSLVLPVNIAGTRFPTPGFSVSCSNVRCKMKIKYFAQLMAYWPQFWKFKLSQFCYAKLRWMLHGTSWLGQTNDATQRIKIVGYLPCDNCARGIWFYTTEGNYQNYHQPNDSDKRHGTYLHRAAHDQQCNLRECHS